jgi:hypothetical protein
MTNIQLISFILLWVVILIEGVLLFVLYRHVGLIYLHRWSGLPQGSKAPEFSGLGSQGEKLSFENILVTNLNLLIFGSFGCHSCHNLLQSEELANYLATNSISGYFLISSNKGDGEDYPLGTYKREVDGHLKILTIAPDTFRSYLVRGTPFVYILDPQGMVLAGGAVSEGPDQIVNLLGQVSQVNVK